ncbi:MAG TPA: TonB family protein [Candidatus Acidoferrales bacterium]|nr:TonB family protein [Candidatus Acidoferrales bacterium]
MASTTTELPISLAGSKSKTGSDALEAEAIGLDVAVRIHGSQVAAVVLESTEHVEPFEEDTSTMIVFPRGAVVKLRARVRTGHAMVLTNLSTKQTALCRIIQVNTAPNIAHYVKLEFVQPVPGFWGVHFPSEPLPSARSQEPTDSNSAPTVSATLQTKAAETAPANRTPVPQIAAPAPPKTPASQTSAPIPARAGAQSIPGEPPARETKPTPPRDLPLSVPSMEYGSERPGQKEDLVPLASGSPSANHKILSLPKTSSPRPSKSNKSKRETPTAAVEQPIFDSLTTQEDIFASEAVAVSSQEYKKELQHQTSAPTLQNTLATIDYSSLTQPGATPKPRSLALKIAAAAVVVLAFVAAGAMYLRRVPVRTSQAASSSVVPSQPALQPTSATPDSIVEPPPTATTSSPAATEFDSEAKPVADVPKAATSKQNSITAQPVRGPETSATAAGQPVISTGMANIYAGDLKARVRIARRAAAHVAAPVPDVNSAARTKGIPPIVGENALGSLVPDTGHSNLVAPIPAAPVKGGNVQPPKLLSSVAPTYPQLAATNHVEGEVKIQAEISASGRVISTKVISGPILLRTAATNAVRQWKYSPAKLDGKAITMQYDVTVRFRLNR